MVECGRQWQCWWWWWWLLWEVGWGSREGDGRGLGGGGGVRAGKERVGKRAGHGRAGLAAGSPHARFSMEKGRRRMVEEAAGWVDL